MNMLIVCKHCADHEIKQHLERITALRRNYAHAMSVVSQFAWKKRGNISLRPGMRPTPS